MNSVHLVGRLGQDVELKRTRGDKAVCELSVATTKYRDGQEKTQWHRVVCWGQGAENAAKYLIKGQRVAVEGELEYQRWEKDGQKHNATVIHCRQIEYLDKPTGNARPAPGQQDAPPQTSGLDDIPF